MHAHPFTEPMTSLDFVRARWYDARTGSFLTPDPLGYNDSANLYTFAGGDPVNGRDPSGQAAILTRNGTIVASDRRIGGGIRRFSREEIARDPQKVRAFIGIYSEVSAAEADALIEHAGHAWATGGDRMRVVAPGAAKAAGVYPLMLATACVGIGGGIGDVVAGELGFGFIGTHAVGGFTAGVGAQAGNDLSSGNLGSANQYLSSGAEGAVVSLAIGGVIRVVGGSEMIPDIFPDGVRQPTGVANPVTETTSARGNGRTRLGVRRTNQADWRSLRNLWDEMGSGEILSLDNRVLIAQGRPPVVDAQWVQHFPGDAPLLGEQITIHHIGGGKISVPLPKSRHIDAHKPGGFRRNPGGPGTSG
jgi:RHS repeat-associated protein